MFDQALTDEEKVRKAERLYSRCRGHFEDQYQQQAESAQMLKGEQWDERARKVLEEQGRPANTFNLLHGKIQQLVGLNSDTAQHPIVVPKGSADRPVAECLNTLADALEDDAHLSEDDEVVFELGVSLGEHCLHYDVMPDPQNPTWVQLVTRTVHARETAWDPASTRKNRSDARYVFFHRWYKREEFLAEYPEHKEEVDRIFDEWSGDVYDAGGEFGPSVSDNENDYSVQLNSEAEYVNRFRGELRVTQMEYKVSYKQNWLAGMKITPQVATALKSGMLQSQHQVTVTWEERVHWLHWFGMTPIFDGPAPVPFSGFSIIPFTCYIDGETGHTYGLVRIGADAQKDVNKAHSQSLDHLAAAGKPGWVAEDGAVEDPDTFEDEANASGSVAMVNQGALSNGSVRERVVGQYSPAIQKRLEQGVQLLDMVTGIHQDAENPNRAVEHAATHMLREKKAIRSMRPILEAYTSYQRARRRRTIEVITQSMPADQMDALLGNSERYRLEPSGQALIDTKLQAMIPIRDLRALKYAVEMEAANDSDVNRANQLNVLLQLKMSDPNLAVDPEVLLELAASSDSMRERLRDFLHATNKASAEAQKKVEAQNQQMAMLQLQMAQMAEEQKTMRETMKLHAERERHDKDRMVDVAKMQVDDLQDQRGILVDLIDLWERAENDQEKRKIEAIMAKHRAQGAGLIN